MATMLWIIIFINVVYTQATSYSGYQVISATPQSQGQVDDLLQYLHDGMNQGTIDMWTAPRAVDKAAKFMVSAGHSVGVKTWLNTMSIEHHIVTTDVQSEVDKATIKERATRSKSRVSFKSNKLDLNSYNDHDDINNFLKETAANCDICETIKIGESYEGRDMVVIKIGKSVNGKKAIWIDAGIHAREWIAPATALNIINKMVEGYYKGDKDVEKMLDRYVFYILPLANPDGYTYSRTTNRLWRKTRSPNSNSGCVGTDPNRNWDFHWGESGVSLNPCAEIYPGSEAFSEVETRNIRDFLLTSPDKREFQVYLTFHSYGQNWVYPWGFDDSLPEDWKDLHEVGKRAVKKLHKEHGTDYTLGSSTHVLYAAAGASDDWAKGVGGIKYSYTVELPDEGYYGFLLPPERIEPTIEEIWPAFVEMTRAVYEIEHSKQT